MAGQIIALPFKIISETSKGIAGGIGLVAEGVHAHKEKKKREGEAETLSASGNNSNATSTTDLRGDETAEDETEKQWQLDEVQSDLRENQGLDRSIETMAPREAPPDYDAAMGRLPMPVILPQRRPKQRTRGFVRGYAPVLNNVNINQAAWMGFLSEFDKSTASSPWLETINLAALASIAIPSGFSTLYSIAISEMVKIAQDLQNKQRTNKFMYEINRDFFQPRGTYCLVMTWRPDVDQISAAVDINNPATLIPSAVDQASSYKTGGVVNKFKGSHGTTYGDLPFPKAAPLIFPGLDAALESPSSPKSQLEDGDSQSVTSSQQEQQKQIKKKSLKDKYKSSMAFIDDYYDRRAQALYASKNPDAVLANQTDRPKFASRYGDPTHQANNGGIVSLLTGGYFSPYDPNAPAAAGPSNGAPAGKDWRDQVPIMGDEKQSIAQMDMTRREMKQKHREERRALKAREKREWTVESVAANPIGSLVAAPFWGLNKGTEMVGKMFKKDVLYLMVVNMPSDEEMEAAKAILEGMK